MFPDDTGADVTARHGGGSLIETSFQKSQPDLYMQAHLPNLCEASGALQGGRITCRLLKPIGGARTKDDTRDWSGFELIDSPEGQRLALRTMVRTELGWILPRYRAGMANLPRPGGPSSDGE
jgi:hypothetical protein